VCALFLGGGGGKGIAFSLTDPTEEKSNGGSELLKLLLILLSELRRERNPETERPGAPRLNACLAKEGEEKPEEKQLI